VDTLTIFVVDVFGGRRGFVMGLLSAGREQRTPPGRPTRTTSETECFKEVTNMDVSEGGDEVVSIRGSMAMGG